MAIDLISLKSLLQVLSTCGLVALPSSLLALLAISGVLFCSRRYFLGTVGVRRHTHLGNEHFTFVCSIINFFRLVVLSFGYVGVTGVNQGCACCFL
jgi:hypothetical protein